MTSPRRRSEAGVSLVEVLVAVVVLGIAVAGVTTGLASASISSLQHRRLVALDGELRTYAEVISQQVALGGYQPCASVASPYVPSASTWSGPPSGYNAPALTAVQYWDSSMNALAAGSCGSSFAQTLTYSASTSDGTESDSMQILVRQP